MRIRAALRARPISILRSADSKPRVINQMHTMDQRGEPYNKADIAASFQTEAISFLADNTFEAAAREGISKIGIAGGVSSNGALRRAFAERRGT